MSDRLCYYCKQTKSEDDFSPSQRKLHGGRPVGRCRPCTSAANKKWRQDNPELLRQANTRRRENPERKEYDRQRSYLRRFGISREDYNAMREAQGYCCAICGRHEEEQRSRWGVLCLDHDHGTGQLRALLCALCNKGLGAFRDDPSLLFKAAAYLVRWKKPRLVA